MERASVLPELVEGLRNARALVFDFDGTLVDSNPIKRHAFAACFAEWPGRLDEILAYCWHHHHVPRDEKFRYVFEQILGRPYTPQSAARLHQRFEDATTTQIIAAPEIPGATALLRRIAGTHLTALLSSTPQETLLAILEGRGWRTWFTDVQGAPVEKAEWLRTFRDGHGLSASEMLFFGDTPEDADAAAAADCPFIHVGMDPALAGEGRCLPNFLGFVTA